MERKAQFDTQVWKEISQEIQRQRSGESLSFRRFAADVWTQYQQVESTMLKVYFINKLASLLYTSTRGVGENWLNYYRQQVEICFERSTNLSSFVECVATYFDMYCGVASTKRTLSNFPSLMQEVRKRFHKRSKEEGAFLLSFVEDGKVDIKFDPIPGRPVTIVHSKPVQIVIPLTLTLLERLSSGDILATQVVEYKMLHELNHLLAGLVLPLSAHETSVKMYESLPEEVDIEDVPSRVRYRKVPLERFSDIEALTTIGLDLYRRGYNLGYIYQEIISILKRGLTGISEYAPLLARRVIKKIIKEIEYRDMGKQISQRATRLFHKEASEFDPIQKDYSPILWTKDGELSPAALEIGRMVKRRIEELGALKVVGVYAFGSLLSKQYSKNSDLDLYVEVMPSCDSEEEVVKLIVTGIRDRVKNQPELVLRLRKKFPGVSHEEVVISCYAEKLLKRIREDVSKVAGIRTEIHFDTLLLEETLSSFSLIKGSLPELLRGTKGEYPQVHTLLFNIHTDTLRNTIQQVIREFILKVATKSPKEIKVLLYNTITGDFDTPLLFEILDPILDPIEDLAPGEEVSKVLDRIGKDSYCQRALQYLDKVELRLIALAEKVSQQVPLEGTWEQVKRRFFQVWMSQIPMSFDEEFYKNIVEYDEMFGRVEFLRSLRNRYQRTRNSLAKMKRLSKRGNSGN